MQKRRKLELQLRPVRRRMMWLNLARSAAGGVLAGSGVAVVLLIASRLFPLPSGRWFAAGLVAAGLGCGLLYAWLRKQVTDRDAALAMDRQATSDAIVTALEMLESEHPVAKLQREDAEQAAARYVERLKEHAPGPGRKAAVRFASALAALWLGAAVLVWVPNPMDDRIAARAATQREMAELASTVAALAERAELLAAPDSAGDDAEIGSTLAALRDRLAELNDPAQALRELEAAQRDLERLAGDRRKQAAALAELAQQMQADERLRALGQALERKDAGGLRQSLESLRSELAQLSSEDRQALAGKLRELAQEPAGNEAGGSEQTEALQQALEEAARAAEGGGANPSGEADGVNAFEALEQKLADGLNAADLEALARQMAGQLGQSAAALDSRSGADASGGSAGWPPGAAGGHPGWDPETGGNPGGLAEGGQSDGSGSGAEGAGNQGEGADGGSGNGQSGASAGRGVGQGSEPGAGAGQGSGQGSGSGAGTGEGSGQGSGSGAGAGQGAGQGSGSGAGTGQGSGQGSGTGQGSGSGAGTGQGAGSGASSGTGGLVGGHGSGSRSLVTTPRSLEGAGNVQQDGGPSGGGQVTEGGVSPVLDGGAQSYEEVYSSYAFEARQSLNRSPLPPSMQQRVRDYFDQIQPNR